MRKKLSSIIKIVKNSALYLALCPLMKVVSIQNKLIFKYKEDLKFQKQQKETAQNELFETNTYYRKQLEELRESNSKLRKFINNNTERDYKNINNIEKNVSFYA